MVFKIGHLSTPPKTKKAHQYSVTALFLHNSQDNVIPLLKIHCSANVCF